ncbi:putative SnoaL-like aldol condensation-catalyzing enzyme [Mesorhizobium soli]|jgi:predicted SnoaL-like aldol condensation-catalyzing enzyme|uniref:nuclear transport factor 2 family protein n=1 Tax=Pseudaminobacter soli (ex Li et al. 2025) TaxID=1295366 RepID=UPI0024753DA6|nr:nuclear transport factor 2 family protein [Mesorhizobium soli]MDH6231712.1 putative SnoaL-like aldol condensation-catalyzing enzyme [Mesorhizobium soli]
MTTKLDTHKTLVADFYAKVWNAKSLGAVADFVADDYIQHNPHVGNGRAALEAFLGPLFEAVPEGHFTIARLIADDDLVVAHTLFQANADDRGTAVVDVYRIMNGRLVEHWDVKEAVPETSSNGNPMV